MAVGVVTADSRSMRGKQGESGDLPEGARSAPLLDLRSHKGSKPLVLMKRLLDGDPLGLEDRSTVRRDELAHLISSERVTMRAAAVVAYGACVHGAEEPIDDWIVGLIDRTIGELLREDQYAARGMKPVEPEEDSHYQAVMELLDLSAENARAVCVAFNVLPFDVRSAYFAYGLERWKLSELADETGVTTERMREDLARALLMILRGVK